MDHKIPKSSYSDNNSVWIGREQLNLGPNVINTASGAHMQWGNRCQIWNTNIIHQFQIQNTKIHRCKIQKYNNAIRQSLPNMKYSFYRPMPNTKYKSANHYQIQNTIIRNILSWAASEIASTRSACLNSRSEEWCLLKQKLEAVMTSHKSWFISAWNHSRDARVTPGTRPNSKESTILKIWTIKKCEECENPDLLHFFSWI